jgi:hypothetical protein
MTRPFHAVAMTMVAALLAAAGAEAHHSFSQFDRDTEVVKTGTVVRWAFNNPHSWLYVNVEDEDGTETLWSFEASAPPSLIGRGITGGTFEPGDTVTFSYCPLRDGRPAGAIGWARLADGSFINPSDGGCNGSESAIERWRNTSARRSRTPEPPLSTALAMEDLQSVC